MSHRPLDTLAKEKHAADRMRYATRKHHIRPDSIDKLDDSTNSYHHGGPYDATLFARNNTKDSPLQALKGSNAEALKATPHEKIVDSIQGHRPLDGVAAYAPGQMDKRWPGVQYHPDDIKGKGEPSYSIEKALKQSSLDEKAGVDGIEMKSQNRSRSGSGAVPDGLYHDEPSQTVGRSGSFSRGLNQRIGSLKKHRQHKHE
jgi:Pal1 cell morphology protein